uniref:Uncharacterized protein n=1 Tax=Chromera velia CCMP2878 TaxID=1169474 RepID=A0A0G4GFM9_9ALVE|eukprot:Cvel_21677.t1-p1 / transcript=Cvel_21677.t1 / gene=Cvel_21677 / organism=Chromera_velia_CCMP2878 / gene_product=hypothetical protein / transcript_product=hypothetical protein / location=Cvel_scaffold2054:4388-9014(+) / protein_length=809 / sequence_SO=supercontig / SO=protein_coding / is_pseudo=false
MKLASRTLGVAGGGVGGFLVAGPVGAVAGGVAAGAAMDGITYGSDVAINGDKAKPTGMGELVMRYNQETGNKKAGACFDLVTGVAGDAVTGWAVGGLAGRALSSAAAASESAAAAGATGEGAASASAASAASAPMQASTFTLKITAAATSPSTTAMELHVKPVLVGMDEEGQFLLMICDFEIDVEEQDPGGGNGTEEKAVVAKNKKTENSDAVCKGTLVITAHGKDRQRRRGSWRLGGRRSLQTEEEGRVEEGRDRRKEKDSSSSSSSLSSSITDLPVSSAVSMRLADAKANPSEDSVEGAKGRGGGLWGGRRGSGQKSSSSELQENIQACKTASVLMDIRLIPSLRLLVSYFHRSCLSECVLSGVSAASGDPSGGGILSFFFGGGASQNFGGRGSRRSSRGAAVGGRVQIEVVGLEDGRGGGQRVEVQMQMKGNDQPLSEFGGSTAKEGLGEECQWVNSPRIIELSLDEEEEKGEEEDRRGGSTKASTQEGGCGCSRKGKLQPGSTSASPSPHTGSTSATTSTGGRSTQGSPLSPMPPVFEFPGHPPSENLSSDGGLVDESGEGGRASRHDQRETAEVGPLLDTDGLRLIPPNSSSTESPSASPSSSSMYTFWGIFQSSETPGASAEKRLSREGSTDGGAVTVGSWENPREDGGVVAGRKPFGAVWPRGSPRRQSGRHTESPKVGPEVVQAFALTDDISLEKGSTPIPVVFLESGEGEQGCLRHQAAELRESVSDVSDGEREEFCRLLANLGYSDFEISEALVTAESGDPFRTLVRDMCLGHSLNRDLGCHPAVAVSSHPSEEGPETP